MTPRQVDPDGHQDRLQQHDPCGFVSDNVTQTAGEQQVRQPHLEHAKRGQVDGLAGVGPDAAVQHERQEDHRGDQVVQHDQPCAVFVPQITQRKHHGSVGDTAAQPVGHAAQRLAADFEAQDQSDAQHRASQQPPIARMNRFVERQHTDQEDPHRRRVLQPDRIRLVGQGQGVQEGVVHRRIGQNHGHQLDPPPRTAHEWQQDQCRK